MWNGADWNWFRLHFTLPRHQHRIEPWILPHCFYEITIRPRWTGGSFSWESDFRFPKGHRALVRPTTWYGKRKTENQAFCWGGPPRGTAIDCAARAYWERILAGHSAQALLGPLGARSHDPFSYFGNQTLKFFFFLFSFLQLLKIDDKW